MSSRDINDCVDELKEKIPKIVTDYNQMFPERELKPIETLRSLEEQLIAYKKGKSQLKVGLHNPSKEYPKSRACDFGVFIKGKYMTDEKYYYPLLELCRKYDLISGIDFKETNQTLEQRIAAKKEFRDWPHIQVRVINK